MKFLAPYIGSAVVLAGGLIALGHHLAWPWWVIALSAVVAVALVGIKLLWDLSGHAGGYSLP